MELHRHHLSLFDGAHELAPVVGGGQRPALVFIRLQHPERVHEVHALALLDVRHDGAGLPLLHTAPAHVRHWEARRGGEGGHLSRDDAQTRHAWGLLRPLEQQLHAQADAQERFARLQILPQGLHETSGVQDFHRRAKASHPGKHQAVSGCQVLRRGHLSHRKPQRFDGIAHAAHIAHPVVQEGYLSTLTLAPLLWGWIHLS
mmetsp:Transcript_327/g.689  ORF Transcript_327/g.689 Transcript_327/m.689 type:complete len:202 (-) Transcript_327:322-927(-)